MSSRYSRSLACCCCCAKEGTSERPKPPKPPKKYSQRREYTNKPIISLAGSLHAPLVPSQSFALLLPHAPLLPSPSISRYLASFRSDTMNAEREAKLARMHEQLEFMRGEIDWAKTSAIKKSEAIASYVASLSNRACDCSIP